MRCAIKNEFTFLSNYIILNIIVYLISIKMKSIFLPINFMLLLFFLQLYNTNFLRNMCKIYSGLNFGWDKRERYPIIQNHHQLTKEKTESNFNLTKKRKPDIKVRTIE